MTPAFLRRDWFFFCAAFAAWVAVAAGLHGGHRYFKPPLQSVDVRTLAPQAQSNPWQSKLDQIRQRLQSETSPQQVAQLNAVAGMTFFEWYGASGQKPLLDSAGARLSAAAAVTADVQVRFLMGRVRYEAGDFPGAAAHFGAVLAADPKHALSIYNLGAALYRRGDAAGARTRLEQAAALQPLPGCGFLLGTIALDAKDYGRAVHGFEQEIAAAEKFPADRSFFTVVPKELTASLGESHRELAGLYAAEFKNPQKARLHFQEYSRLVKDPARIEAAFAKLNRRWGDRLDAAALR